MALFLSPYVGTGTKDDTFRPQGLFEPGASAVDIRLDSTRADGDGIGFGLLWSPSGIPDPTGAIKLAEDYGEPITALLRNLINTRTGLDFSRDTTIQDVVETIMLRPDTGRWKQLRAFQGRLELWLGSSTGKRKWIDSLVLAGGSITDDFSRADEATLKYPWVRQSGSAIFATLSSNAIRGLTASGQGMYYYDRSVNGWSADHSSSFRYASAITSHDWGPTVRNGASGRSCYSFEQWSGGRSIAKYVNGSATTIETVTGSASTGVVYKIDVSGSTIRYYEDGVEHAGSPASDTSLSTAGFGPGVILYRSDGSLDDFVATGEQTPSAGIIFLGSTYGDAPNGGDVTVDLTPLSLQENDLVVLGGSIGDNDNIDFTMALVGASGWTKQADLFADDTQDVSLGVWTKVMGATPDSSVVVDGQGGSDSCTVAIAKAFRGVDPTTPMDVAVTTATGINTAHADPPSIDHNNPSGVATVVVVASGDTGGGTTTYAPPTGYESAWESQADNDTSDTTVGMGVNFSPADPENPGTATYSGTDSTSFAWAAVTLALRPAVTAINLAAALSGTGAVAASLTTSVRMAAALPVSSQVAAALTTSVRLATQLSATSALVANLLTDLRLASVLQGTSAVAGNLQTNVRLASALQGAAAVAAAISAEIRCTAQLSGLGTLAADLTTGPSSTMTAVMQGAGVVQGTLSTDVRLASALASSASVAAQLATQLRLVADLAASGAVSGALETDVRLASVLQGVGAVDGSLATDVRLQSVLAAAADLSASLMTDVRMAAALAGAGQLSADLIADNAFRSNLQGAGSLVAALQAEIQLALDLQASGHVAAQLATDVRLAAQLAGLASVSARLQIVAIRLLQLIQVSGSVPTVRTIEGQTPEAQTVQGAMATMRGGGGSA